MTEGHRVTMTFNLYSSVELATATSKDLIVDYTSSPFYHELQSAIRNPAFMKEGGILAFPCQHYYIEVKEKLNHAENLPVLLKGSDNVVYSVAKLLSLNVSVKPVNCEMNAVLSHFQKEEELVDDVYESDTEALQSCFDVEFENITWATSCARVPVNQHLACVYLHYGNEQV